MRNFTSLIKYSALVSFSLLLFACADSKRQTAAVNEPENESKNKASASPSTRVSAPDVDSAEPAIAAAPDGGTYLVWVEHGAGRAADVYFQKFDGEAKAVAEKVRINPQAGEATAWRGDPPTIAVGANGEIYVGWTASVKTATASGTSLYVSVSRDGGKSFAAPVKVNDDSAPASHGMHSLATDKSGKIYVAWLDERNIKNAPHAENKSEFSTGFQYLKAHHTPTPEVKQAQEEKPEPNSEIFYAVSRDGAKTFAPNKKISSEVCPCCKTSLLASGDGKVYVSWRQVLEGDFRHIAVASTADGGESFSAPAIVSDDHWQITACPVSGASMAIGETGALKVAWFTAGAAGKPGLYTAESTDGGKSFSARTLINESAVSGNPLFLARGGGYVAVIVWEATGKLFRAKIEANQIGNAEEITDGAVPSAAFSGGKIFIGFSRKEGDKRGVRLTVFNDFQP
ncbi:MAG TPA: sialidase family protein [Pyrinomonadaceae bacterium]